VNATRAAAEAALRAAKLEHELVTFAGADHAFFNDTGPRYNATAAAQAYERVLDWFDRFVAHKPTKAKPQKVKSAKTK
jgi:carboxymethylenebutenolidase